jgi:hypothetical protein
VKAWVPGTVVAMLLAGGIGAAGYYALGHGIGNSPSPTPSIDLHSKEAVIAAVRVYYKAEDKAGETGTVDLVRPVTTGPGTPAYENLKLYFLEQAAKNRGSVITADDFSQWDVSLSAARATVQYAIVQHGHDIDLATRLPVETETRTPKGIYKAILELRSSSWLLYQRDLLRRESS